MIVVRNENENKNEKTFFLDNDKEVNCLVFRIGWVFFGVLCGIFIAALTDVFKVEPITVLHIMVLLSCTEAIFYLLLKKGAPVEAVKYYGLLSTELCLAVMISNAYFGIYISYILVPVISCLYFDRRLTRNITALCYIAMLIGLWLRAPGAIELAYPGYTRVGWFVAFSIGYSFEYLALSAVVISVSKRAKRYMLELYHRRERIEDIQRKIIYRFADLIESRDDSTGKHVKRTSKYVMMIADKLRESGKYSDFLTDGDLSDIELAAPLHDIGKIVIPDSILKKPGKLTPEEFEIIKTHTTEGSKIIDSTMEGIEREEFLGVARDIALSHHEKWDGTGYPKGLADRCIPLSARIMAVADVFDALVSERCYKKAISVDEAFDILKEGSGKHFDPYIVDIFISSKDEVIRIMNDE